MPSMFLSYAGLRCERRTAQQRELPQPLPYKVHINAQVSELETITEG
jgi:hypothetical protein